MQFVKGLIYQESGFVKGYMGYHDGLVTEISTGNCLKDNKIIAKGVVLPLLTNCHTHIGDAIAYGLTLPNDIQKLVTPPNGLKFKILRESKPEELIAAMKNAIIEMLDTGTITFCDFREGGLGGINLLKQSVDNLPINTLVMGRPEKLEYSKEELNKILSEVSGIGVSSITDWEYSELEKIAKYTKDSGKLFALHASERLRENLDEILDLKPDYLIHMTYGTDDDFERLAELELPVVLCLRSNIFFKNIPNLKKMIERGVVLVLGSDNAMINSSNLFEELKVAFKLVKNNEKITPKKVLDMITINLKKVLNPTYYINLAPGTPSNFMVLDIQMDKPELALSFGITQDQIKIINIGNNLWKKPL